MVNTSELQKINKHGQVTLPKFIREALALKNGDFVATDLNDDGSILIRPIERIIFKGCNVGAT